MRDHTIDEALVELARTMKALKALRAERKTRKAEDLATMYLAPKGNGDVTPEQVQAALNAPYSGWKRRSSLCRSGQARQPGPDAQTGRLEGGAMNEDDESPKCGCGEPAEDPHTCPFKQEIYGSDDECTCCDFCRRCCADDR